MKIQYADEILRIPLIFNKVHSVVLVMMVVVSRHVSTLLLA